jgi:hypothetical protein
LPPVLVAAVMLPPACACSAVVAPGVGAGAVVLSPWTRTLPRGSVDLGAGALAKVDEGDDGDKGQDEEGDQDGGIRALVTN